MPPPTAFPPHNAALLSPSLATHDELSWFFTRALEDIDASRVNPEAGAEILNAARQIHARLRTLPDATARLLQALFADRVRPAAVTEALGVVAGAVEVSPAVLHSFEAATRRGLTRAPDVTAWLAELLARGVAATVAHSGRRALRECLDALRAYDTARGRGLSVVPSFAAGTTERLVDQLRACLARGRAGGEILRDDTKRLLDERKRHEAEKKRLPVTRAGRRVVQEKIRQRAKESRAKKAQAKAVPAPLSR